MPRKVTDEDRRLAIEGWKIRRDGGTPTLEQSRAIRRVEAEKDDEQRWKFYKTVPKRHYEEMSNRQRKVINEQARRYGIPIEGSVVDLTAVIFWIHEFLAENKHKLCSEEESGSEIDAVKLAKAQVDLEINRLELEERAGRSVSLAMILNGVRLLMSMIRTRIQAIPGEMAPLIPVEFRQDVMLTIDDKFRMILLEMAAWAESSELREAFRAIDANGGNSLPKRRKSSRREKSRRASVGPAKE